MSQTKPNNTNILEDELPGGEWAELAAHSPRALNSLDDDGFLLLPDFALPAPPSKDALDAAFNILFDDLTRERAPAPPVPPAQNLPAPPAPQPLTEPAAALPPPPAPAFAPDLRASFEVLLSLNAQPPTPPLLTPALDPAFQPAVSESEGDQFMLFTVDGTLYAVAIENVVEVNRPLSVTPLPNLPPWFLGITNLRGDILSVFDLRVFFGQSAQELNARRRMMVVRSRRSDVQTMIVVDQVRELSRFTTEQLISSAPGDDDAGTPYLRGVARHKEQKVRVLDLEKLLQVTQSWHTQADKWA